MKHLFSYLIALFLLSAPSGIFAQGCDEPDSSSDSDDSAKPKIIGFAQPQYEYHLTQDNDRNIENSNTFKFKRARIGITGNIPYDFSYYAVLEMSSFVSSTGNPYLLDAFISYRRFKWANISMGSFKQPFGLEVNTACSKLHTIERAAVSDQIVAPQRDMGLMIFGGTKSDLVQYKVALMNGTGLGVKDNNNKKDIIGRIIFNPIEYVSIGGSFRHAYPTKDTLTRSSYGIDLQLDYSNFLVQAEYIYDEGDYNRAAGGGCGADPLVLGKYRSGYYIQGMYKTYFNLQPVIKYEYFKTGDSEGYEMSTLTFGVNYFFNDNIRLQANYRYNAEFKSKIDAVAEIPNDAVLLQMQVKF